jgi:hypothetical protein
LVADTKEMAALKDTVANFRVNFNNIKCKQKSMTTRTKHNICTVITEYVTYILLNFAVEV